MPGNLSYNFVKFLLKMNYNYVAKFDLGHSVYISAGPILAETEKP